ncbi:MAG: PQQ-dependent sugar dehydrogenase, partial [Planctomycetes bacterium]|nr:PQQ-dependent sugar dehydrogenase [Planctomycetota bacterium]
IPKDNPVVGRKGARPEVWAYGLRQTWRFDFDPKTGNLWAGEVGQDLWEMVYLIRRGGNYGWSVSEGGHPFRPQRKTGPTPILPPVTFHAHSEARSLTGGYVYRSKRLSDLRGAYVYGDYDTGKIWALRWDGKKVTRRRELVDTQLRIVSIGQDRSGEVYFVDHMGGRLHRLAKARPTAANAAQFPRKLSQTGLFASTKDHRPAAGLIPYSVNAPLWSDAAVKERFIALPGNSQIELDTVTYPQPAPGAPPGWRFPDNTVLVKTFSLEMETGNPASRRRLETRLLHFKHMPGSDEVGAQFWRGYTYVWNDAQTDAELLAADGLDRTYTIKDVDAPGGVRKQIWRFPSRAECTLCHTMSAKYSLGVNTLQMNKDHNYGGVVANQLSTLEHLGMFTKKLPKPPEELPRLVDYRDAKHPVQERARSYLHANCAHCHRKWGGGNAEFQLLSPQPLAEAGVLGVRPGHGNFGLDDPRLIVPGDPGRSIIHHRMDKIGLGRMPHIGSNLVDRQAVDLIARWIKQMPAEKKTTKKKSASLDRSGR